MNRRSGTLKFSPTDITTFWESAFASWMDRQDFEKGDDAAAGRAQADDSLTPTLKQKGIDHEARTLERFVLERRRVVRIEASDPGMARSDTIAAMKAGADVVHQAYLEMPSFGGRADFLVKVGEPSKLGAYSYEVWDTKLGHRVKSHYVLQLCAYAEMLQEVQGRLPARIAIVLGDGQEESLVVNDFLHYYRRVKDAFLWFQQNVDLTDAGRPDPERYRSYGRWETEALAILSASDSLTQIAGIRGTQVKALHAGGIMTMTDFARRKPGKVPGLAAGVVQRLHRQAKLQVESKGADRPKFEVLDHGVYESKDKGLYMLPEASPHDVYFDIEGYPFVKGGLEYLWGAVYRSGTEWRYKEHWAHDDVQERAAFEAFIDWVYGIWRKDPAMRVYHYASYEASVIKRFAGRFGSREDEVDELLYGGVFVDLHQIVKESIAVGVDTYSLKEIERLYRDGRVTAVADATSSIVVYDNWVAAPDGGTSLDSPLLGSIRDYNREDCESMVGLVEFLRGIRKKAKIESPAPCPAEPASEVERKGEDKRRLMKALMDQASPSREDQLLAQLLDYHRRERRPAWQRFFERHRLRPEDLESDPECLAGLRLIETLDGHRAIYAVAPDREHKVKSGATFKLQDTSSGDKATVTVHDIDLMGGRITLDFPDKEMISSDLTLIPRVEVFFSATLEKGLRQVGEIWLQSPGSMPAVGSILRRDKPRLQKGTIAALLAIPGDMTQQAIEVVRQLDRSHLIIQGPPGTGKTTLAAAIIQALLQDGKKVGITSNSHEAINLLLLRTVSLFGKAGSSKRANLQVVKVNRNKEKELIEDNGVVHAKDGKSIKWKSGAQLVGGTAWAFAAESSKGKLDYLFVDEASQVPLANLVAMGLSATNIVLLGDQMQLPNPAQGHHPGDSGLSVLEYLLGDKATVDETEGMFLPTSYRMHPDVCTLVSEMVYEGKLDCDAKTGNQSISKPKSRRPIVDAESGVVFVEVPHAGNSQASKDEVATIKEIVAELKTRQYTDQSGRDRRSLTDADILVVAPYNMQVAQLAQALGNSARVGTVDKFQGQEAPVVIVSMCASDLEEIPRGVEFLLSKNRMNVAISRAQCLAIVVGSPALAESRVASIEGMRLVNLYCRIVANGVGKAKQPKAS